MRSQKIIQMAEIALMSAVLCVLAPFSIPIPMSPVPLSLATFAVYLSGALLGVKKGTTSVLVYLLLGAVGLPVFSGFSGGIGKLLGPTGGYIMGYLPCVLAVGFFWENGVPGQRKGKRMCRWQQISWKVFAMVLGTCFCYIVGSVWFFIVMKGTYSFAQVFWICVAPYPVFDLLKIMVVAAIATPIRNVLRKMNFV